MTKQIVSVIIPCFNEENNIKRLLSSLKDQSFKHVQIIVVDDASKDRTVEIAKRYTSFVFPRSHAERSVQRNFGASKAKGDYLLFLDADMKLSKNVIKECVNVCLKSKKIGAVAIPEVSIAMTFWEKVKAYERSFYNAKGDATTDAERFFTKAAFKAVGGYDETITGPEDWDLPENIKKHGFLSVRIKSVIYHYERVPSPWRLAKKKYYYALTSHRYLKKHNISLVSGKTIYFLRPVFYKNWQRLLLHPVLTIGLITMFTFELFGGGLGYIVGKVKHL